MAESQAETISPEVNDDDAEEAAQFWRDEASEEGAGLVDAEPFDDED